MVIYPWFSSVRFFGLGVVDGEEVGKGCQASSWDLSGEFGILEIKKRD
jgi:hypothetical protein